MGWRRLTETPDLLKLYRRYGGRFDQTGNPVDPMSELLRGQEKARVTPGGDVEVKTRMAPISLGRMSNTEYALTQANWPSPADLGVAGVRWDDLAYKQKQGLYRKLAETPGVDRIRYGDFQRVVNAFSPDRMGIQGATNDRLKQDLKAYYLRKYPQIRSAVDPTYNRKRKKARGLRNALRFHYRGG